MQPMTNSSNGPHIKTEPSIDGGLHLPSYGGGSLTAQQRAAQNLAATFGPRAAASISAIQTGIPQQSQHQSQQQIQQGQQQSQQQQQQRQGISAQRPPLTQTQYQQAMALQAAQQRSQIQNQGGVNGSQTDGSGDADVDALGPFTRTNTSGQGVQIGRVEIDRMVRQKIEAMSHSIEGGGLMLPLKELPLKERHSDAGRKRLKTNDSRAVTPVHGFMASRTPTANLQYDVVGDDNGEKVRDEELDEDAINSELDDSDDGGNEEEDDDDSMGNIMLCMYDKVQRVKNKWSVILPVSPSLSVFTNPKTGSVL
jgi:transcription initiation factor TFIIA large subunit